MQAGTTTSAARPDPPSLPGSSTKTCPPAQIGTDVTYKFTPTVQNATHRDQIEYHLSIWQQPQRARMVGSGEKSDRRPIDPPPIVQLKVVDKSERGSQGLNQSNDITLLRSPHYFCYATLCLTDGPPYTELVMLPNSCKSYMVGSVVSSLHHLREPHLAGGDGHFFVFGDLGVRVDGRYRLRMSVYEIVGHEVWFCVATETEPFEVFSPKKFPGMVDSTDLSRTFANQGIRLRVRTKSQPQTGTPKDPFIKPMVRKKQRVIQPDIEREPTEEPRRLTIRSSSCSNPVPLISSEYDKIPRSHPSNSLPHCLPSLRDMLQGALPSNPGFNQPPILRPSQSLQPDSAPQSPIASSTSSCSSINHPRQLRDKPSDDGNMNVVTRGPSDPNYHIPDNSF